MSQFEIMDLLDKHPGVFFTGKVISDVIGVTYPAVMRSLRQIVKRSEYEFELAFESARHRTYMIFRRKK